MNTSDAWIVAREAEIAALQPLLTCRVFVPDTQPGHPAPCNALTPADVRQMLYERTGILGWRVRMLSLNLLEVLPPDAPSELEET